MAVKTRAAGCVIFLCVCVVCSVLPVRAQSIFDVPKEMVDHASGKAMDMLRHDQGRLDDDTPPPADMPVDVSLDVSVKAGLPGVRSFVVGPVFNASDNVPVNKRVIVPETQQDLVIRGVIIAPDVSFVDMVDADMYFDFVQKNLLQSVVVIGFKDFNETATVQVGHSYIGQAMTLQTLRRMLSELQGYIRAVKGYERASIYLPKQNATDGVLNLVVKKFGLKQRDVNHARFYEAAPVAMPSRRPVIPIPVRKAAVPESFLAVLASAKKPEMSGRDSSAINAEIPTGLERFEAEKIPVAMPILSDSVKPVVPTIQGFVLIVDEAFVGMEDLKNFYNFNRQYTGQVIMPVGVDPEYTKAVMPVLRQSIGRKLTEDQLERILHGVGESVFSVLRAATPSYETVKADYHVSLPDQQYDMGVVYLVVR